MKKRNFIVLLALVFVAAMLVSCRGGDDDGLTHIRLSLATPERAVDQEAYDALMEALRDRGFRLTIETFERDVYQIHLVGLDTHLIGAAAWDDFFGNARAGAFAPITREQVRTNMPLWYRDNADLLTAATVDGNIYAIPMSNPGVNVPFFMLRTDWFPPGMTEIATFDDLYAYLAHSLYLNPGIIPINLTNHQTGWQMAAKGFGATHLIGPGGRGATSPVVIDKRDYPNFVLRRTYEDPGYIEFLNMLHRFNQAGFLHSDSLHNPIAMQESFFVGDSAVFTSLAMHWTNWIHGEFNIHNPQEEAQIYVFDMGRPDNVRHDFFAPMGHGLAIPAASVAEVVYALQFIELLYTDRAIHHLWRYGIEGVHYELRGEYILLLCEDGTDMPVAYHIPYENHRFLRTAYGGLWPGFHEFDSSVRSRAFVNPFAGFSFNPTVNAEMVAFDANIQNLNDEFLPILLLGMVDCMDTAVADFNNRWLDIGLEAYEYEMVRQMNEFIEYRGLNVTITLGR